MGEDILTEQPTTHIDAKETVVGDELGEGASADNTATVSQPKTYLSTVILDYLRMFWMEYDRVVRGIGSDLDYVVKGKKATADKVIRALEGEDTEDEGFLMALAPYSGYFALLFLIVLFSARHPADALGFVLAGAIVVAVYKVFFARSEEGARRDKLNSYIRLRDPSGLLQILGDMMGFCNLYISDDNGRKHEIEEQVDKIVSELTTLGGFLDINTLQRVGYYVKKLEGIALGLGHLEVTIEDYKDIIRQQAMGRGQPMLGDVYNDYLGGGPFRDVTY